MQIRIENIHSAGNVRTSELHEASLATSMDRTGLISPIVVVPMDDNQYLLIAGHRRVAAARSLDWTHIEAHVTESFNEERDRVVAQYHENVEREDLSAWDRAQTTLELKEMGLNQRDIAKDLVLTVETVSENQQAARTFGALPDTEPLHQLTDDGLFDLMDEAEDLDPETLAIAIQRVVDDQAGIHSAVWQARRDANKERAKTHLAPLLDELRAIGGTVLESRRDLPTGSQVIAKHNQDTNYGGQLGFNHEQVKEHRVLGECHAYLIEEGYDSTSLVEYCIHPAWHTEGGKSPLKELDAGGKAKTKAEQKAERKAIREAKKARIERVKTVLEGKWTQKQMVPLLSHAMTLYADDQRAAAKALGLDMGTSTGYDKWAKALGTWIEGLSQTKQPWAPVMLRVAALYIEQDRGWGKIEDTIVALFEKEDE